MLHVNLLRFLENSLRTEHYLNPKNHQMLGLAIKQTSEYKKNFQR